jgi:nucleotide-binding universal stress UspA family protein
MKILIAYDGSECAEAALNDLQRAGLPQEAEVIVISVDEQWLPLPSSYGMAETSFPSSYPLSAEIETLAEEASQRLRAIFPAWQVHSSAIVGSPASAVLIKADGWQPDLIVVGSHGRTALGRFLLGSVSQKVLSEARCSVRIARGRRGEIQAPARIAVGLDGSPESEAAVRAVAARAWPAGSEARVITVLDQLISAVVELVDKTEGDGRQWIRETLDATAEKLRASGLTVSSLIKKGDPRHILPDEAESWRADCIFVGARGLSRFERFRLGSVSGAVAARAHCSVEVVRTPARS